VNFERGDGLGTRGLHGGRGARGHFFADAAALSSGTANSSSR